MEQQSKIKNFSISIFSIILGLAGFTLTIQKFEGAIGSKLNINMYLLILTMFLFTLLLSIYIAKLIKYPMEVKSEFKNPMQANFFSIISISLLIFSLALQTTVPNISKYLLIVGTVLHTYFTYRILSFWMMHDAHDIKHFNPTWFITVVGTLLIPLAGINVFTSDVLWFYFTIGIVIWFILFTIFMYRIIFEHPLHEKLIPTLAIIIAPPAIGSVAYVALTSTPDSFSKILYFFALFLTTFLLSEIKLFFKLKFTLSWWAYSFPISAMTIASINMYKITQALFYKYLGLGLVAILITIIIILVPMTIKTLKQNQ